MVNVIARQLFYFKPARAPAYFPFSGVAISLSTVTCALIVCHCDADFTICHAAGLNMAVWSVGSRTVQATLPTVVSTITGVLKSAYANDCGSMRTHNLAFSPHEFAVG